VFSAPGLVVQSIKNATPMMARQMIPPVFFFLVGLGLSYLVAKRTNDSASWIAVGVSSAILAAFAALFSGDLIVL
jgi:hypothetical protein